MNNQCNYCNEPLEYDVKLCDKCLEDIQTYNNLITELKATEELVFSEAQILYKRIRNIRNLKNQIIDSILEIQYEQK